jgi:ATP-dependent DNA helicase RecG
LAAQDFRKATGLKLDDSAIRLPGVGPDIMRRLGRLGVETIGDLLCLVPIRYEDRTEARKLGSLRAGEKVLVEGEIALAEVAFARRRSLLVRLADGTGSITLRFFHFSRQQQTALARGMRLRCFGEVRAGPTGLEMVHPEYGWLAAGDAGPEATLTPVYPTTEGLQQGRLRRLVTQALAIQGEIEDYLEGLLDGNWPTLAVALRLLHQPPRGSDIRILDARRHPGQRRIALEELIAQRLSLKQSRALEAMEQAPAIAASPAQTAAFAAALPFKLTSAQTRVIDEIRADLALDRPMHRLLQGDVGSGKTVVAAFAMYLAAASGCQAALMAPTELLAEQHATTLARWFAKLGLHVALFTGSLTGVARRTAIEAIASGDASLVVGTHALFQEAVSFARLALIVVDEQHRFGVEQRLALKEKGGREGRSPHQLTMTATPIPRTLAMTAYAGLDCSIIDELPAGREPVQTIALPRSKRPSLVLRVAEHCKSGAQAYWVCPLIEVSEQIDAQAAEALYAELGEALPEVRIGLVHGRLRNEARDALMRAFKAGEIDLLVATTVIEVGVDVPNASLMIVEGAERMGLAQLHQLRGRVGRGERRSSCVLLYEPGLSALARERIDVMRRTTDGFVIAEKDLELRGPGEVLGTRQTGVMELRVADLQQDADLLPLVVEISDRLEREHPERLAPLIRRWIKSRPDYASV